MTGIQGSYRGLVYIAIYRRERGAWDGRRVLRTMMGKWRLLRITSSAALGWSTAKVRFVSGLWQASTTIIDATKLRVSIDAIFIEAEVHESDDRDKVQMEIGKLMENAEFAALVAERNSLHAA